LSEFDSAKAVIRMRDGTAGMQISELLVTCDGSDTYSSEYAIISSASDFATIVTSTDGTSCSISVDPTVTPDNMNARIVITLIKT
jgi:hypothetical protein